MISIVTHFLLFHLSDPSREVSEGLNRAESSTTSTSSRSSTSDYWRSKSSPSLPSEPFSISMHESTDMKTSSLDRTPSRDDNTTDHSIEDFNHDATVVAGSSTVLVSEIVEAEGESAVMQSLQEVEEDSPTPSLDGSVCAEFQ